MVKLIQFQFIQKFLLNFKPLCQMILQKLKKKGSFRFEKINILV